MGEVSKSRYMVQAGWSDVPHISPEAQQELLDGTEPYLRDARSKGIPNLGTGAIYPIHESEITVPPFQIPDYWTRAYAMDVGWKNTAAMWGAKDPSDGVIYLYGEYKQGEALPVVHASAIKTRGEWIKGAIDPASRGRSQRDGEQLFQEYRNLGLKLVPAENAVDAGIYRVWSGLVQGRIKLFSTLSQTLKEYRMYHRVKKKDENGVEKVKIVKKDDHLMDCKRYLIATFDQIASVRPVDTTGQHAYQIADQTAGY